MSDDPRSYADAPENESAYEAFCRLKKFFVASAGKPTKFDTKMPTRTLTFTPCEASDLEELAETLAEGNACRDGGYTIPGPYRALLVEHGMPVCDGDPVLCEPDDVAVGVEVVDDEDLEHVDDVDAMEGLLKKVIFIAADSGAYNYLAWSEEHQQVFPYEHDEEFELVDGKTFDAYFSEWVSEEIKEDLEHIA